MSKEQEDKREQEIVELYSYTNCLTYIDCDGCNKQGQYDGDQFDVMDDIYEHGWRIIKGKCLCKECQKQ